MRELHECQAEVFLRSEKRIEERRARRKHILMACIPLVLCITIFGAFLFPGMDNHWSAPESSNEQYPGAMGSDEMGGLSSGSVEVTGNGLSHLHISAEDIQEITGLINTIVAVPEINDGGDPNDNKYTGIGGYPAEIEEQSKEKGYQILIKQSDGTISKYLLIDSVLIDLANNTAYDMDENTIIELKKALGIPTS